MTTVLVTGANRGLGLEFCRQYAERQYQVIAACRKPDQAKALRALAKQYPDIRIVAMDVMQRNEIDNLAQQLRGQAIDALICNAGIYGDSGSSRLGHLNYSDWLKTLETNVLGAIKTAEAFLPHLKQSSRPVIAAISSQMGSIEDNTSGGSVFYRSSKAALNAAMKSLAIDLQAQHIGVLIFHPGWVLTDMGGPNALIDVQTSISGMITQIDRFDLKDTGRFIKYDGSELPW
jgi:NAD(P)-dependent dehydrogenase (short-subunit alcohol dehydrogenase family)